MQIGDQVQVWGDGPHSGPHGKPTRGPERRVFEGSVEAVGKRRIIVRRPGMPWREKSTFAFDATSGRAIQANSAMFLKLNDPVLWSPNGGPDAP